MPEELIHKGNFDETNIDPERPLVTFALFAYNQEKYIAEAVEGALAQTYSPLEIIISDDCSTDGTWDLVTELIGQYKGGHKVIVRRNEYNLGVVEHINKVFEISSADWIIMAAGDDISSPMRAEKVISLANNFPSLKAIYSDRLSFFRSDELKGIFPGADYPGKPSRHSIIDLNQVIKKGGYLFPGATWAYHKDCHSFFGSLPGDIYCEDRTLPLRASVLGNIGMLKEKLVAHRQRQDSLGSEEWETLDILSMRFRIFQHMITDILFAVEKSYISAENALKLIINLDRSRSTTEIKTYIRHMVKQSTLADNLSFSGEMIKCLELTGIVFYGKVLFKSLFSSFKLAKK